MNKEYWVKSEQFIIIIYLFLRVKPRMDPRQLMTLKADVSKTRRDFSKITSKWFFEGQILSIEINLSKRCSWPLTLSGPAFLVVRQARGGLRGPDGKNQG